MGCRRDWTLRALAAVLSVTSVACGRIGFSPESGTDATSSVDASACVWTPFGSPQRVLATNNTDDWFGSISRDDQALVFTNFSSVTLQDMQIATRIAGTFGNPRALDEINSMVGDEASELTADGTLWFASTRAGGAGGWDIWTATRQPDMTFVLNGPASDIDTVDDEDRVSLSSDGLRIYLVRADDIWFAERTSTQSAFGTSTPVGALNSNAKELGVSISSDELEVFFSSERPGGMGAADIYTARRSSRSDPFGPVEAVSIANTAFDDVYPSLSSDGTRLYYNRDAMLSGGRDADVWVLNRTCQ